MSKRTADLCISLLGSFEVVLGGRPVTDFGTDKTRALLAYLAVEADRCHRRDALAGLLWPDSPQPRARQSLRQALSQLRQALGDPDRDQPFLSISRETVRFNAGGDYWLDVAEFTRLAEACQGHHHRGPGRCLPCIKRMEAMAGLYGDSFLSGFSLADSYAFEEWATLQGEHFQRQMMDALTWLVVYYRRRDDLRQALAAAFRQVQIEPWREEVHRRLMRLLARDGQRSAALAQYETCRRVLAQELGVPPAAETTALYQQIEAGRASAGPGWAAHLPATRRHNLPASPTPFVGRSRELAEIAERLADPDCRLVTVTGPGGVGKTRLALEVAAGQVGLFEHGVTFVPLAALASADLFPSALAEALRFHFYDRADPEQQLLDLLRDKQQLLVLDNVEHVLDVADFIARLLDHAPGVAFLLTSRERLNLREEWVYALDGLVYPGRTAGARPEAYDAVTLFVQTARRADHRFSLAEGQAPAVARICRLVEGLPLAVELAAAWWPLRTCHQIAAEIERTLDTLSTTLHNVPARHRSLRAAFEHSWSLLPAREQAALGRLSIFESAFAPGAAEQVAGVTEERLTSLAAKSLLRRDAADSYALHRLLRQYVHEKEAAAGQGQALRARYVDYYARFLQVQGEGLLGGEQLAALEAIAAHIDDVRAAWGLAVAGHDLPALDRSLVGLGTFYSIRSWHREGEQVFGRAAERLSAGGDRADGDRAAGDRAAGDRAAGDRAAGDRASVVQGHLLAWQGHFAFHLGRYPRARLLLDRGLDLLRREDAAPELAFALHALGQLGFVADNEYDRAEALFREALALYRALGDRYGAAHCLDGLGDVAARQGAHDEARQRYKEGLDLRREIGDLWGLSVSLGSLGGLAGRLGAYDEAGQWFEESLALSRQLQNARGTAACLHNLSTVAYLRQDYARAKQLRLEVLEICCQIGYRWGIASALRSLGDVAGRLGEYEEARRFFQESLLMLEEAGDRRSRAYTLDSLGAVVQAAGDRPAAWGYFRQALAAAAEIQEPALILDVVGSMARLTADAGDVEQALELAALVLHHPAAEQQTRDQLEPLRARLVAQCSPELAARLEARGRGLELDGVAARLLAEA